MLRRAPVIPWVEPPAWLRWLPEPGKPINLHGRAPVPGDRGGPWRVECGGFWLPCTVTAFTSWSPWDDSPRLRPIGSAVYVIAAITAEDRQTLRDAPPGDQWWRRMHWTDQPPQDMMRRVEVGRLWWRAGLP
jgi:hypothetical protein